MDETTLVTAVALQTVFDLGLLGSIVNAVAVVLTKIKIAS